MTFYSNGKLLITSEYLVMDGAIALALPTKFGQNLVVKETDLQNQLHWTSFDDNGNIWFETHLPFSDIINKNLNDNNTRNILINILHAAYKQNPAFVKNSKGYEITTNLTFPRNWGLGTSSTLINNIAQWLNVDAYNLLNASFGGSGYDLACAQNNTPILYQLCNDKPVVQKIDFKPTYLENIYFIYLNQKQSSKESIATYRKKNITNSNIFLPVFNELTQDIISAQTLTEFECAIGKHEAELSKILEMPTVQDKLFADFNGKIKSLGAWGGDFVLATSKENPVEYFNSKGYFTVLAYEEMIFN